MTRTETADRFVREETERTAMGLVPEFDLNLASEPIAIFLGAEKLGAERPYWAFAWSGGQALARWLLDNPDQVAGRSVLDVGSGSAISSIAALKAGAREATANDTDPMACAAARLNATMNGVDLGISEDDLLASSPDADIVLIGDLFYEPDLVTRVGGFLERASRRGATVLYADRSNARRPPVALELLGNYTAPLTPAMEIGYVEYARVWRLA